MGKTLAAARGKGERDYGCPPPGVNKNEFWQGSTFGVAVAARSFPGIIAIHANPDYILNFEKEIGVQSQIDALAHHSESEFIAFLDGNLKVVAHTDRRRIGEQEKEPLSLRAKVDRQLLSQVVEGEGGKRYFEVVKPVALDEFNLGFIKIGLSLGSMEIAWHNSLRAIVILSVAILAAGILGMAAIFHNQHLHLQEVKALEIEVLQRERLSALGNLAASVAHEIRNPLNSISMGLHRLKVEFQPVDDPVDYTFLTNLMLSEVRRLNSIVEQFLSLARPIEIKAEALLVPEFLRELATMQENQDGVSSAQIQVIAARNLPPLTADPSFLKQVLLNLMLNGLQAMPHGGTLTLEAKTSNGRYLIAVTDTGIGITEENLRRIFEPYFTTKVKGTGLGLAISRKIIEAHGGTITAANQPSGGCRCEISLPLSRAEV